MPHLENWAFVIHPDSNPYEAPELRSTHIAGLWTAGAHPRLGEPDGKGVTTSRILSYDHHAKIAVTRAGTVYSLGEPDPVFVKWLETQGKSLADYHKHIQRDTDHGPPTQVRRLGDAD